MISVPKQVQDPLLEASSRLQPSLAPSGTPGLTSHFHPTEKMKPLLFHFLFPWSLREYFVSGSSKNKVNQ